MTNQTKHFIDLSDILSLRFECKHCDTTLSLNAMKHVGPKVIHSCPNCNEDWATINGTSYVGLFSTFTDALARLTEAMEGQYAAPVGFRVTLEIKPDAVTKKDA